MVSAAASHHPLFKGKVALITNGTLVVLTGPREAERPRVASAAPAVAWLPGDESSLALGADLRADGGFTPA